MLCNEIMSTEVEYISPKTTLREATGRMRDRNIGFLPICDEFGRAIGAITDRDIAVRAVARGAPLNAPMENFMPGELVACRPSDDVERARELMESSRKSRIICTGTDGRLVGVISLSDLAQVDDQIAGVALHRVSERTSHVSAAGAERESLQPSRPLRMQCSELMKTDIECVSPQTSLRAAAARMRDQQVGFLAVCDEAMRPVGALTDRDIAVRAVAEGLQADTPVEECMTREVIACSPWDSVEYACELMEQHQVSRIVCTNRDRRIEGVISLSDIVDLDVSSGSRALREISQREYRGDSIA